MLSKGQVYCLLTLFRPPKVCSDLHSEAFCNISCIECKLLLVLLSHQPVRDLSVQLALVSCGPLVSHWVSQSVTLSASSAKVPLLPSSTAFTYLTWKRQNCGHCFQVAYVQMHRRPRNSSLNNNTICASLQSTAVTYLNSKLPSAHKAPHSLVGSSR